MTKISFNARLKAILYSPERIRASLGKLIFESMLLLLLTAFKGSRRQSVKMLHKVVPTTTKAIYGMDCEPEIFTTPELLRKIHTNEFIRIGAKAQKKPSTDCLYSAFRSRLVICIARNWEDFRSFNISLSSLKKCVCLSEL